MGAELRLAQSTPLSPTPCPADPPHEQNPALPCPSEGASQWSSGPTCKVASVSAFGQGALRG